MQQHHADCIAENWMMAIFKFDKQKPTTFVHGAIGMSNLL